MIVAFTSILLYASVHSMFALQYLRSSLTVPLHFERRLRKDSNYDHKLPGIDRKIRLRVRTIQTLQVLSLVLSVIHAAVVLRYALRHYYEHFDHHEMEMWVQSMEWLPPLFFLSIAAAVLNLISFFVILTALILVKRWISDNFGTLRTWKWSVDGLFAIYLLFFSMLFVVQSVIIGELSTISNQEF